MTPLKRWWIAIKLPSLIKVILPLLVGMGLGYSVTQSFSPWILLALVLYAWFLQLYIVFFNDVADEEADFLQKKRFPQLSSSRVIPDGLVSKQQMWIAGLISLGLLVGIGILFTWVFNRIYALPIIAVSCLILWLYSFPPIKLNYRGLGELLEMIGVGIMLPVTGYYLYTGMLFSFPLMLIVPVTLLALASAVTSGLKDKPADELSGKRTITILFGTPFTKYLTLGLIAGSLLFCAILTVLGYYSIILLLFGVLLPLILFVFILTRYRQADHQDIPTLRQYKKAINYVIYATNLGLFLNFVLLTVYKLYL